MLICGMHKQQRRQRTKQRQFKTIWVVVVYKNEHARAVRVNELIPREFFCMLYTQCAEYSVQEGFTNVPFLKGMTALQKVNII